MREKSSVALVKCATYDRLEVRQKVQKLFEWLGGPERFMKPGEDVLIKPNLLSDSSPEKAITTHPAVVDAVAWMIRKAGAIPYLGDSPAAAGYPKVLKKTGLQEVIEKYDIGIVSFKTPRALDRPQNVVLRKVEIAEEMLGFKTVFNLCKLKTHVLTHFTGAVKNMYGCVPGLLKSELHIRVPDPTMFSQAVLDIYGTVLPTLSIMDGIVGMEGTGPNNGIPREIGALLASVDGLALDATALRLVGQDPMKVPTVSLGADRLIGKAKEEEIVVLGDPIGSFSIKNFQMPHVQHDSMGFPPCIGNWIRKNIVNTPKILSSQCTRCRRCEKICPAHAISFLQTRMQIDLAPCIRCFCCMEVCPAHAIVSKPHSLTRLFNQIKKWAGR